MVTSRQIKSNLAGRRFLIALLNKGSLWTYSVYLDVNMLSMFMIMIMIMFDCVFLTFNSNILTWAVNVNVF